MALLLFAPLMALIFLIVKLDGGPAFFWHTRIGKDGRAFTCWKFRSMVVDSEEVLEEVLRRDPAARAEWKRDFKLSKDPRRTAIGAFLRKSRSKERRVGKECGSPCRSRWGPVNYKNNKHALKVKKKKRVSQQRTSEKYT